MHVDYSNGLYSATDQVIDKLQKVQNFAAKVILSKNKYESASEYLKQLQCPPICQRIEYKLLMTVHKCLKSKDALVCQKIHLLSIWALSLQQTFIQTMIKMY